MLRFIRRTLVVLLVSAMLLSSMGAFASTTGLNNDTAQELKSGNQEENQLEIKEENPKLPQDSTENGGGGEDFLRIK